MRCPTLEELPPPPVGRSGWPWTEATPRLPLTRNDGSPWPTISIVTPSFNQGHFIEETVRSVLLQGYPALDYAIVDGGSSDESADVIKRYEKWLSWWTSEVDQGQPHAINKGLARASGELFNWINSDDLLTAGALHAIGEAARGERAVAGYVLNFREGSHDSEVIANSGLSPTGLLSGAIGTSFHQPGLWLWRSHVDDVGGIADSLQYAFDFDLVIRYLLRYPDVKYLANTIAAFRLHDRSKTCMPQDQFQRERILIYRKLLSDPACVRVHRACLTRLRSHSWWEELDAIERSEGTPMSRAIRIVLAIAKDPAVRTSRLTLGAMKRALVA